MHKTEYYPNTLGATINNHSVIEYDDTVKQKVISSYISG